MPSALLTLRCRCSASQIWSPTVCTGDSEVIGSWKMIEIEPPRRSLHHRSVARLAWRCR